MTERLTTLVFTLAVFALATSLMGLAGSMGPGELALAAGLAAAAGVWRTRRRHRSRGRADAARPPA